MPESQREQGGKGRGGERRKAREKKGWSPKSVQEEQRASQFQQVGQDHSG